MKYFRLAGTVKLSLQKAISQFYQDSFSRMVENIVRLVNSMSIGSLLHFICSKVSSWIRSNAVQNALMVDKAFCKSTDGSLGRSIECREEKSIFRVSV